VLREEERGAWPTVVREGGRWGSGPRRAPATTIVRHATHGQGGCRWPWPGAGDSEVRGGGGHGDGRKKPLKAR
jgi:hypothetical protein